MIYQKPLPAVCQRHRKKITTTLDEIAPVFCHGLMCRSCVSFDGLRFAPPILRILRTLWCRYHESSSYLSRMVKRSVTHHRSFQFNNIQKYPSQKISIQKPTVPLLLSLTPPQFPDRPSPNSQQQRRTSCQSASKVKSHRRTLKLPDRTK